MFVCPVTGCRLIKARVKGGMFWYSPESDGRLLTLHTFKHFLGEYASNEIWMRSENASKGHYDCPGCKRKMVQVSEPEWIGTHIVDVCRACWVIWLEHTDHPEIPKGSDIDPNVEAIKRRVAPLEAQVILEQSRARPDSVPDSILHAIPALISLPVKTISYGSPLKTWLILIIALFAGNLFLFPNVHSGIFYGLSMYFFYLFSSDLEMELSHLSYLIFFLGGLTISCGLAYAFQRPFYFYDLTSINFSLMTLSLFQPVNARFSYLIPFVHYLNLTGDGRSFTWVRAFRWVSVPQWVIVGFYFAATVAYLFWLGKDSNFFGIKTLLILQFSWGLFFKALLMMRMPFNRL